MTIFMNYDGLAPLHAGMSAGIAVAKSATCNYRRAALEMLKDM